MPIDQPEKGDQSCHVEPLSRLSHLPSLVLAASRWFHLTRSRAVVALARALVALALALVPLALASLGQRRYAVE